MVNIQALFRKAPVMTGGITLASLPARFVLRYPRRALASIEAGTQAVYLATLRRWMYACLTSLFVLITALTGLVVWKVLVLCKLEAFIFIAMMALPAFPAVILTMSGCMRFYLPALGLYGSAHTSGKVLGDISHTARAYDRELLGMQYLLSPWEAEVVYLLVYPQGQSRLCGNALSHVALPSTPSISSRRL